jgi:hypothetical protein
MAPRKQRSAARPRRTQMGVTIPAEIRDRLEAAANRAGHSIGEEIRSRLERTFRQDAAKQPDDPTFTLYRRIFGLAAMALFATGREWFEDPGVAYLLQLTIDRLLQRRYGAKEVSEVPTTEEFQREVIAHTDPAQLANAIEAFLNAKMFTEARLDEAYRRGGPAAEEHEANSLLAATDEVHGRNDDQ